MCHLIITDVLSCLTRKYKVLYAAKVSVFTLCNAGRKYVTTKLLESCFDLQENFFNRSH